MKKITLFAAAALLTASSFAQNWKMDAAHSKIHFNTQYLVISTVEGEFKKMDGTFSSSNPDWTDLKADVTVDVKSLSTDNDMRDKHLMSDDFFNADKFPTIRFVSTGVKSMGNKKYVLTGNMTIRDVTRPVQLDVVYNGTVKDPWGNTKAGFRAFAKINRKDFGLKYNNAAATGEAVVSDEVGFNVDLVLIKQ